MKSLFHPKCVLFDLDGTLIDHFNCIYKSFCYGLQQLGLPLPSFEEVKRLIGGGLPVTLGHFVEKKDLPRILELFFEKYDTIALEKVIILKGAAWILESLFRKGYKIGIMTNKTGFRARKLCENLGFNKWTSGIYGAHDTAYFKPALEFTQYVLGQMQAKPEATVLIGDTVYDIETAENAKMSCLIVATGAQPKDFFQRTHPMPLGVYTDLVELGNNFFNLTSFSEGETNTNVCHVDFPSA